MPLAPFTRLLFASCLVLSAVMLTGCNLFDSDDEKKPAGLTAGLYEMRDTLDLTEEDFGFEGTAYLHGFLQLRADGSYLVQAYMTTEDLEVENILVQEERGRFSQQDTLISKTQVEFRVSDPTVYSLASWEGEDDYETPVRAISANEFQIYDDVEMEWHSWKRLSGAANLITDDDEFYLDPASGYSLRLPSTWTSDANLLIEGKRYHLRALAPTVNGGTPNLIIQSLTGNAGQTLEARMNSEADALAATSGITVLSRNLITRGGVPTAVIVIQNATTSNTIKQKLVMFQGPEGTLVLQMYSDLAARFDQNAGFQSIDASLKFY